MGGHTKKVTPRPTALTARVERPPMTPLTIALTIIAAYLGAGALLSWSDVRAVVRADPETLCSEPCRRWHELALPHAIQMMSTPNPLIYFLAGVGWPLALARRCGCFRRA